MTHAHIEGPQFPCFKSQARKQRNRSELYLVSESHLPSLAHYFPVNCAHRPGCICVCLCVCLCVSAPHSLSLWFTAPLSLSPLLLAGQLPRWTASRLGRAINLNTSYHCLALQGGRLSCCKHYWPSSSPSTNPVRTTSIPQWEAMLQGRKTQIKASFTPQRQRTLQIGPSSPTQEIRNKLYPQLLYWSYTDCT